MLAITLFAFCLNRDGHLMTALPSASAGQKSSRDRVGRAAGGFVLISGEFIKWPILNWTSRQPIESPSDNDDDHRCSPVAHNEDVQMAR